VLFDVVDNLDEKLFERHIISFAKKTDSPFQFKSSITLHHLFSENQILKPKSFIQKGIIVGKILCRLYRKLATFPKAAVIVPFLARPTTCYTVLTQLFSKRRIIASVHTTESKYMEFNFDSRFKKIVEHLMVKIACRGADKIVAVSESVKSDLIRNYLIPEEDIRVISNPINLSKIERLKTNPAPIWLKLGTKKTIFVHIGRLSAEKNHKLLIQAAANLIDSGLDFVILIAGAGDQEINIRSWIQAAKLQDRVIMLGSVNNPYALMASARALLLTSHYDSSPMVLKEAMASGTAVISVDCPHGPADILKDGKYGLLVPPGDPQALAGAMLTVARDDLLFKRLVRNGHKRALIYDIEKIIPQWEKMFWQVQRA